MNRTLPLLLLALMTLLLGACAQPDRSVGARSTPIHIDTVTLEVRESAPPQVIAHVQGILGDGCVSQGPITQKRTGTTVELTILGTHSGAEACTMIAQLFDQRILLEGDFVPGSYVLMVNGVAQSFTV